MGKTIENNFMPEIALPPGVTLKDNIEFLGITQEEFAAKIGITSKHLSQIINGTAPITYETALKLEKMFGTSASFWINLETNYQLHKARISEANEIEEELEILKSIPYKELCNYRWLPQEKDKKKRINHCRTFYQVSSLKHINNSYNVKFRQSTTKNKISDYSVIAWLRAAEIEGSKIEVVNFNKSKLEALIPLFRSFTLENPNVFFDKMRKLCSECGVALVLVPSLPRTYINGATIWSNGKAILALSVRGKKADIFWFTFFHELAHILHHRKNQSHVSIENDDTDEEVEADKIAGNYLINEEEYRYFIDNMDYCNINSIESYSKKINIASYILIGRLLHDKLIDFKYFSKYRPSFEIVISKEGKE